MRTLAIYEFEQMRAARRSKLRRRRPGICAYCGEHGDDLVVDHDHETGQIRGLVHRACNVRIGSHTAANVYLLVEYLNRRRDLGVRTKGKRKT